MTKMLERLKPESERTQLFIWLAAVVLVVIAAMLVPLAFRAAPAGEDAPAADMTLEERTLMFADYWNGGAETHGFTVTKPDPVPRKMKETCETVIRTTIARSIDDKALSDLTPTGTEVTFVRAGDGRELHVCRAWLERRGDWQNWMDFCFDADTGELYYFYLSRENLTNRKLYARESDPDAREIAESLAAQYGWTLRYLAAEEDGTATALFSARGGTLCYSVSARFYDALIDVKLSCR